MARGMAVLIRTVASTRKKKGITQRTISGVVYLYRRARVVRRTVYLNWTRGPSSPFVEKGGPAYGFSCYPPPRG